MEGGFYQWAADASSLPALPAQTEGEEEERRLGTGFNTAQDGLHTITDDTDIRAKRAQKNLLLSDARPRC